MNLAISFHEDYGDGGCYVMLRQQSQMHPFREVVNDHQYGGVSLQRWQSHDEIK